MQWPLEQRVRKARGGFPSSTPEVRIILWDHYTWPMALGPWCCLGLSGWPLRPASYHHPLAISHSGTFHSYTALPLLLSTLYPICSPNSTYHPTPHPSSSKCPPFCPPRTAKYFQRKLPKLVMTTVLGSETLAGPQWHSGDLFLLFQVPARHSHSPQWLLQMLTTLFKHSHHHMPSCLLTILYHNRGPWLQPDWEHSGGPLMPINSLGSPPSSSLWPRLLPVLLGLDPVFPIHCGFWLHHLLLLLPVSLNSSWLLYHSLSCNLSLLTKPTKHSKHSCDLVYPSGNLLFSLLSRLEICVFTLDYLAHSHLL